MNQERNRDIADMTTRLTRRRIIFDDSDDEADDAKNLNQSGKPSERQQPATPTEVTTPESMLTDDSRRTHARSKADGGSPIADVDQTSLEASSSAISNLCLCLPDPKIPRPRNAFILYRQHHQSSIVAKHPELTNPEISKIIGDEWNQLSEDVKGEWRNRAEEEKVRHSLKFPDYRYQPKRPDQRSEHTNANHDLPTTERCEKCGLFTNMNQVNSVSKSMRPILPAPVAASPNGPSSSGRRMPSLQELRLNSPQHVRSISNGYAVSPGTVPHPNTPRGPVVRYVQSEHDAKRRRYTNGGAYGSISNHPGTGPQYAVVPAYRDSFGRPAQSPQYSNPPSAALSRPHGAPILPQNRAAEGSLTLAPIQSTSDQNRSVEAMVMSMSYLGKIRVLGRISPPYRNAGGSKDKERGPVIAVEGDNEQAVSNTITWLRDHLNQQDDHSARIAPGPTLETHKPTLADYHALIQTWHQKSADMIKYLTKRPAPDTLAAAHQLDDGQHTPPSPKDTSTPNPPPTPTPAGPAPTPIILLHHYQLHASNLHAARIPIADAYSPIDHWQWMATLWRGTVGPDLTIFVQDCGAEELARESGVEVCQDVRCVVVRRDREASLGAVEERNLRRLGFEVGEVVRASGFGELQKGWAGRRIS